MYLLKAQLLDKAFLDKLTNKLYWQVLPMMQVCCTHPIPLCHAPLNWMGLGLPSLYMERGIIQIKQVLKHPRQRSPLRDLLLTNLQWVQLHAGVFAPILQETCTEILYIEQRLWISVLQLFLQDIEGSLPIETIHSIVGSQGKQNTLMDTFIQLGLSTPTLSRINQVCIYLQVEFLSNLVDPRSLELLPGVWDGPPTNRDLPLRQIHQSILKWPHQPNPPKPAWDDWHHGLSRTFVNLDTLCLCQPIKSQWQVPSLRRIPWTWSTDPTGRFLYQLTNTQILCFPFVTRELSVFSTARPQWSMNSRTILSQP